MNLPYILMVDCKTMLENRMWAIFYMKEEKADRLTSALEVNHELSSMFKNRFSDRMGKEVLP